MLYQINAALVNRRDLSDRKPLGLFDSVSVFLYFFVYLHIPASPLRKLNFFRRLETTKESHK